MNGLDFNNRGDTEPLRSSYSVGSLSLGESRLCVTGTGSKPLGRCSWSNSAQEVSVNRAPSLLWDSLSQGVECKLLP